MPVFDSRARRREARNRHIEELKEKLELIAGEPVPMGFSEHCSDELKERFLESVVAFEEAEARGRNRR